MLESAAAANLQSSSLAVALADGLMRLGKPDRGLVVVDCAADLKAVGDEAPLSESPGLACSRH